MPDSFIHPPGLRSLFTCFYLAWVLSSGTILAQGTTPAGWQGQLETGGWVATGPALPFWLRANQWAVMPLTAPAASGRATLWKEYAPRDTARRGRVNWSVGVEGAANAASSSQLLLPQAYVKLRWRALELAGGRWRQLTGLGDSTLSSGFINGSANALPLPKIQLATLGYIPLGFTKRFVAINAGFGHGWFNVPYLQGSYLHQKYLYLRLGKPASRLKAYGGANHEVQWGGQADYLWGTPNAVNGKLPSAFKHYPYVVLGLRPDNWEDSDYTSFDGAYWFGNGLGSIDLGLEWRGQRGRCLFYHQHIFEDVSGLWWRNFPDGLTGLSWQRQADAPAGWLQRLVVEVLNTMDQSGPTFDYAAAYQGQDNYFNHGQYREGWSYLGRTLGTPFLMTQSEVKAGAQSGQFFPNNRVQMLYLGAMGQASHRLAWQFRLSVSRNWGTYGVPYTPAYRQVSALTKLEWRLGAGGHSSLVTQLALDEGQLLANTFGGYVGLRHQW